MHSEAFGLKAPGFAITPDPHYLYLSKHHQEALAHLLYGAEHDGFVLLTGEVGTGKTTVCRAFLQQLPPQVHVALILNPAVSAVELLQAICHEFQVAIPEDATSIQVLNAHLNDYLLNAHAQGLRPVLLIDEAQGLQPEVLEQVRLLTNLETATRKLLQIFLVGQPELRDLLDQEQLRQVSQRITARYHLTPLTAKETSIYIQHRLAVAGTIQPIFTPGAIRQIHRVTGGIPRLINILCDRAMLGAYATHKPRITRYIVKRAYTELQGIPLRQNHRMWRNAAVALFALSGLIALAYFTPSTADLWFINNAAVQQAWQTATTYLNSIQLVAAPPPLLPTAPIPKIDKTVNAKQATPQPATPPLVAPPINLPPPVLPVPAVATTQPTSNIQSLPSVDGFTLSRQTAMYWLLQTWGIQTPSTTDLEPCTLAQQGGLYCRSSTDSWTGLQRYDYPAVLRLSSTTEPKYVLMLGLDQNRILLASDKRQAWIERRAVESLWTGTFLILWKPPLGGYLVIGRNSSAALVQWLRTTLNRATGNSVAVIDPNHLDEPLEAALMAFQTQYGLQADGIAGPETLIRLTNAANLPNIPRLRHQ